MACIAQVRHAVSITLNDHPFDVCFYIFPLASHTPVYINVYIAFLVVVDRVQVAGVRRNALFTCRSQFAVNVDWLINGTSLTTDPLKNVEQHFDSVGDVGSLWFINIPIEYNGTIAQCRVHTTTNTTILAPNSTLLIQGINGI